MFLKRRPTFLPFGVLRTLLQTDSRRIPTRMATTALTLYHPVTPDELDQIKRSNWTQLPAPREGEYFYPVANPLYANEIAWGAYEPEGAYIVKFNLPAEYLSRYRMETVGARWGTAYVIPVTDLDDFNRHIVGAIEVAGERRE
jgi:hypothetical protein